MRISDWSSDVCSSDLQTDAAALAAHRIEDAFAAEILHALHQVVLGDPVAVGNFLDGRARVALDRTRVVSGKSVSVRVDLGGRRILQKNTTSTHTNIIVRGNIGTIRCHNKRNAK